MCNGNNKAKGKSDIQFDPHDDRPFVKDLIEEHSQKIEEVRQKILSDEDVGKPLFDPKRYDDLWILRYLLSNKGKVKEATKAALKTIQFRDEKKLNDLGDTRHLIRNYGVEIDESAAKGDFLPFYHKYNAVCGKDSIIVTQPDPNRGVLVYMDVGAFDIDKLMETMTKEEQTQYRIRANEATYQVLDEVTRRTGRLTKLTQIMDETNVSILKMNRKAIKQDAEISKELEDYYPQLLASIYIFNAPSWVNTVWALLKPIFPKRLVSKIDFMPNNAAQKLYKPILKHVSEENLPTKFGGMNRKWPLPSVSEQLATAQASQS